MSGPATTSRADPGRAPLPPLPEESGPRTGLAVGGDIAVFGWRGIRQTRQALRFAPEILRQAGIIATGSLLVILLISFFAGSTCGVEMTIVGRQFGADTLSPGAVVLCTWREVVPFVFGYILAAKVGCGIVAELGAMRIGEEIDALDVMGVRSLAYLATTRMLAAMLILPIIYVLAQAAGLVGSFLQSAIRFGDISTGTWWSVFFAWQDPTDILKVCIKGWLMSAFVIVTATYYGYTVRGGPVEVGAATARSMGTNIVGVTLINVACTFVFWGVGLRTPIA